MEGHAEICVERFCQLAKKDMSTLQQVATPCIDDHQIPREDYETTGEFSAVCVQIVLKYLYLARIGRPDLLWSVSTLARSVPTWNKACHQKVAKIDKLHQSDRTTQASLSCGTSD